MQGWKGKPWVLLLLCPSSPHDLEHKDPASFSVSCEGLTHLGRKCSMGPPLYLYPLLDFTYRAWHRQWARHRKNTTTVEFSMPKLCFRPGNSER
jgi:hypothetical protein